MPPVILRTTVLFPPMPLPDPFVLSLCGRVLDCRPFIGPLATRGAHVMGILNVTPDSFSDGGRFATLDAALRQAEAMLEEGAAILDVGGESTRPGAPAVEADEEKRRVLPVVEAICARFPEALVSIDTYKPDVAEAALERGAHLVNDVTGLREHPETAAVAARFGAGVVVMHALGRTGGPAAAGTYADVVEDVAASLRRSVATAEAAGVESVVVDPGFGFGKTPRQNLALVAAADRLRGTLGRPVLLGLSRKSTIGALLGTPGASVPSEERLFGTLGATAVGVLRGATLVRTHDVRPTVEMLRVLAETMRA